MGKIFRIIKINFGEIFLLILMLALAHKISFNFDRDSDFYYKREDIYYEYEAAKQIQKGENPYLRIFEGVKTPKI